MSSVPLAETHSTLTLTDAEVVATALLDGSWRFWRRIRSISLPKGMTQERLAVLSIIDEHEPISIKDLSARAGVAAPTMSRTAWALVDDGHIKRQGTKKDRRAILVSLTAKGRRAYATAHQKTIQQLAPLIDELSKDQRQLLVELAQMLAKKSGDAQR